MMIGNDVVITRGGLVVSESGKQPHTAHWMLYSLLISSATASGFNTFIGYENETITAEDVDPSKLPDRLLLQLQTAGGSADFLGSKTFPIFLTSKINSKSRVSFYSRPERNTEFLVFKNQKVQWSVEEIAISFVVASETAAVAIADRSRLFISIYHRQDEFERLFGHLFLAAETPILSVRIELPCYQLFLDRLTVFFIEDGVTTSVGLCSVSVGRSFIDGASERSDAKKEGIIATEQKQPAENLIADAARDAEALVKAREMMTPGGLSDIDRRLMYLHHLIESEKWDRSFDRELQLRRQVSLAVALLEDTLKLVHRIASHAGGIERWLKLMSALVLCAVIILLFVALKL